MPQYPLANLPQRTRWFQALLVVNLVILGLMSLIGLPLKLLPERLRIFG